MAEYTPGAKFAGTSTEMLGFQLAVLMPVLVPVTTAVTPVRSEADAPIATTVAD